MKKQVTKISFNKTTIAAVNSETIGQIKGGTSIPTDFDDYTFLRDCPSISK
ncbi:hypothetical protein IMCC3317_32950 [Kordia antarctica]|uniref:Uncharacterized protein n=1 Tax=Kordia antarctica TaxID=1218801 RepID=A0A7L4ZMM4_9FLAO|nr:class I lanthipeptide [Kordia antarctica]QHI37912.1 hypothetical protein IMCC3317_32950 [Kordia antarctica]